MTIDELLKEITKRLEFEKEYVINLTLDIARSKAKVEVLSELKEKLLMSGCVESFEDTEKLVSAAYKNAYTKSCRKSDY